MLLSVRERVDDVIIAGISRGGDVIADVVGVEGGCVLPVSFLLLQRVNVDAVELVEMRLEAQRFLDS